MYHRPKTAVKAPGDQGALLGLLPEDLKKEVMSRIAKKQKIHSKAEAELKKERTRSPAIKNPQNNLHKAHLVLYHSHSTASNRDIYQDTQFSNDRIADSEVRVSGKGQNTRTSWLPNPFKKIAEESGLVLKEPNRLSGEKFTTMKQQTVSSHLELSQQEQQPMGSAALEHRGLSSSGLRSAGRGMGEVPSKKHLKISELMRTRVGPGTRGSSPEFTAEEDAARFGSGKDEMKESAVERTPQHQNTHGIHPLGGLDRERTWARLQYGRIRVTGR